MIAMSIPINISLLKFALVNDMDTLKEGLGLSLTRLNLESIKEIEVIYKNNPKFFKLLAGIEDVPLEYIVSEIEEAPLGLDKRNKYFIGIYSKDSKKMLGVADFLINYPEEGEGVFGLLLLSEVFQDKGFGRKIKAGYKELIPQYLIGSDISLIL